jgi:hypothetical protein
MRSKLSSFGPLFASLATLVAAPLVVATNADAAGFATARFGAEHGHPTTENPTALYYNPAGLAEDTPGFSEKDWRVKIFVDGNVALRAASFTHAPSEYDEADPEGAPGANAGTADLFNVITAPAAFASFQLGDFALGAGFFVPFGGQSSWSQNDTFANNKQFAGPVATLGGEEPDPVAEAAKLNGLVHIGVVSRPIGDLAGDPRVNDHGWHDLERGKVTRNEDNRTITLGDFSQPVLINHLHPSRISDDFVEDRELHGPPSGGVPLGLKQALDLPIIGLRKGNPQVDLSHPVGAGQGA